MLTDRVTQRCIAFPRHPFPYQRRKVGAGVHTQLGFSGDFALEKGRTECPAPWGWMACLVLQGSSSIHTRCSPATGGAGATRCGSQQQPCLLVGLEVGLTLGCCNTALAISGSEETLMAGRCPQGFILPSFEACDVGLLSQQWIIS